MWDSSKRICSRKYPTYPDSYFEVFAAFIVGDVWNIVKKKKDREALWSGLWTVCAVIQVIVLAITLKISSVCDKIVSKFEPFIQIEQRWQGESAKHSVEKVVANGRIGMLQLLGDYLYPSVESDIGRAYAKKIKKKCAKQYIRY